MPASRRSLALLLVLAVAAVLLVRPANATGHPALHLGVTHGQRSLDPWEAPVAVADGRTLLTAVPGTLQNQHIMGWGVDNPEPLPGHHDWSTLDRRMALIRETGGTPVITLCCAPDWMKGGVPGITNWARLDAAPLTTFFDDFAALAAAVARRYPDVRYFQVWNEMKGFWDLGRNRWRYEDYTTLYNKVYRALKAVNPAIQVGGPYVYMTTWKPGVGGGRDSDLRGPWGMVDQRTLDVVEYWLKHAAGADFVVVDGSAALRDGSFLVSPEESVAKFAAVDAWLRARTSLPIWWGEATPVPYGTSSDYDPAREAALWTSVLDVLSASGADVALFWQPESTSHHTGLWTSVATDAGGRATPVYDAVRPWLG